MSIRLKTNDELALKNEKTFFLSTKGQAEEKIVDSKLTRYHGLFFGTLSAFCLGLSNVLIKKATMFNASEQTTIRYALQMLLMFFVIIVNKKNFFGPPGSRKLLCLRGLLGMIGLTSIHYGIKLLGPADMVAIVKLNIVFVSIIARFTLKEKINVAHLVSLALSVVGVFLIAQPSFLFPKEIKIKKILNFTASDKSSFFSILSSDISVSNDYTDSLKISIGIAFGNIWLYQEIKNFKN